MTYATRLINDPENELLVPKNFHIDSGFFTSEDVDNIKNYCASFSLRDGLVFDGEVDGERKAKLHFIERPDVYNQWIYDKMNTLVGYYNDTMFHYDLAGYKYMQYAEYHIGGHQRYHTDIRYDFNPGYIMECFRKLTVVLMLSDVSEYDGGELMLNLSAEFRAVSLKLQKGQVVLFPSYIPHQVNPVTRGVRKTLVVWPLGPKFR